MKNLCSSVNPVPTLNICLAGWPSLGLTTRAPNAFLYLPVPLIKSIMFASMSTDSLTLIQSLVLFGL